MNKVTKVTQINIVSEGSQLKKLIEENFTYKSLAKRFNIDSKSIRSYVGAMQITNNKFKEQIEEVFQKPFPQLVSLVEEQLQEYILAIKNNIRDYNEPTDNKTINDQYQYAMSYCRPYNQMIAKGNLGLYTYNMGLHDDAIKILGEVVKSSIDNDLKELVVYYSVQLAFLQLEYNIKESRNILFRTELIVKDEEAQNQMSHLTLFNYYYFYGIVLNRTGKYSDARAIYHKALEFATDDSKLARTMFNIGLSYYEQKKYKYAMEWNRKALDKGVKYSVIRSSVLNNIANIYLKKGEIGKASVYINMAMETMFDNFEVGVKMAIYDTYLEIHSDNMDKLLNDILVLLQKCIVVTELQHYLSSCVKKISIILMNNKDYGNLKKLVDQLINYCDTEGDKRSLNELKAIGMDIIHYLRKEGVFNREKGCESIINCITN